MKKTKRIVTVAAILLLLAGVNSNPVKDYINESISTNAITEQGNALNDQIDIPEWAEDKYEEETADITESTDIISLSDIPEYSGEPYVYINGNVPFFTEDEITSECFYSYSELDSLGRCGQATACISSDTLPTEDRGDISDVYPTGWVQNDYGSLVDGSWLYNRAHLIAASLGGPCGREGEDSELLKKDLITSTRYMNIDGMWGIEETVLYYVKENPENHIMYRVTPVYDGANLLASGVLMEAYSVEDGTVRLCVYCYNVQPGGIVIDYATGENYLAIE